MNITTEDDARQVLLKQQQRDACVMTLPASGDTIERDAGWAISGPVLTVSRSLTRRTGVTMVALRKARRLWSAREGRCPMPDWSPAEFAAVARVLDRRPASTRAP